MHITVELNTWVIQIEDEDIPKSLKDAIIETLEAELQKGKELRRDEQGNKV